MLAVYKVNAHFERTIRPGYRGREAGGDILYCMVMVVVIMCTHAVVSSECVPQFLDVYIDKAQYSVWVCVMAYACVLYA